MAYSKRIPPIKIKLSIDEFNKVVEVLNIQSENKDENLANKSSKLKDKMLRYSVPITNENEDTVVDIRFYQNEILDIFYIIFDGIKEDISVETDYFNVLIKVREKIKQEKMTNE